MNEKKVYFGFKAHTVCGDYKQIKSIDLLCTLLATFTTMNSFIAFYMCAIPIFTVATMCYKYESAKWFEDSDTKLTNTLYIVSNYCSTILLQIVVLLILSAL